jgi:hypothetical protein
MTEPGWVGPTVAISLVVIAASFLAMGAVALAIGLGLRRRSRALEQAISTFATDARAVTTRLKGELDGYMLLSGEARGKLRGAIDTVDGRLKDLDALVEVLQEEAEETALDLAAFMRTVRRTGGILGTARRLLRSRRRRR